LEKKVVRDDLFRVIQTTIDAEIDGWIGRPAGITMSCTLVSEFLRRGLLLEIEHQVDGASWIQRSYRGQLVQPDPSLEAFDYFFGMPTLQTDPWQPQPVRAPKRR